MNDRWKRYQGQWVSFWPKPEQYDAGGYQSCLVFIGKVLLITPRPDSEIGRIPNADMTVEGLTKRVLNVNSLTHNVRLHRTYEEADNRRKCIYE